MFRQTHGWQCLSLKISSQHLGDVLLMEISGNRFPPESNSSWSDAECQCVACCIPPEASSEYDCMDTGQIINVGKGFRLQYMPLSPKLPRVSIHPPLHSCYQPILLIPPTYATHLPMLSTPFANLLVPAGVHCSLKCRTSHLQCPGQHSTARK